MTITATVPWTIGERLPDGSKLPIGDRLYDIPDTEHRGTRVPFEWDFSRIVQAAESAGYNWVGQWRIGDESVELDVEPLEAS